MLESADKTPGQDSLVKLIPVSPSRLVHDVCAETLVPEIRVLVHEVVLLLLFYGKVVKFLAQLEEFVGVIEDSAVRAPEVKVEEAKIFACSDEAVYLFCIVVLQFCEGQTEKRRCGDVIWEGWHWRCIGYVTGMEANAVRACECFCGHLENVVDVQFETAQEIQQGTA